MSQSMYKPYKFASQRQLGCTLRSKSPRRMVEGDGRGAFPKGVACDKGKLRPLIYFQWGGYRGPFGKETLPGNAWSLIIFYLSHAESLQKSAGQSQRNPPQELCRQRECLSVQQEQLSISQLWGLAEIKRSLCPALTLWINHPVPSVPLLLTPAWPFSVVRRFHSKSQNK